MGQRVSRTAAEVEVEKLLEGEPPIYVYSGHGGDTVSTLKDVPNGSKYINMGTCGLSNRLTIDVVLPCLENPHDTRFVETNVPQIEELLGELSIRIYMPNPTSDNDRYVNNIFYPIGVYPNEDGTFNLLSSGLIERKKCVLLGIPQTHDKLKTTTLETVKSLFSMSVYPTIAEVDAHFRSHCADRLEALTYADLTQAYKALSISVETLMTRFPGIHYNFMCRSVDGNPNLPPHPSILRRANSAEAGRRPENAILLGYREHYALLNLLETALLFEERRIPLNPEKLARISKTPIYKIVPGDQSALKTSLITHLATGPASTWNPPKILTQFIKNSLLSAAIEKEYNYSVRFLMKLGAECSREQLLSRFQKALDRRDAPAVVSILQEHWVDATFRNNVFVRACSTNFTELATALLATKQVDVNAKDLDNMTALMYACMYSNSALVELLVREPGIDLNIKDGRGYTALSYSNVPALRARLLALGARDFDEERAAAERVAAEQAAAERVAAERVAAERAAAERVVADRVKALCFNKPAVSPDLLTDRDRDITELNIYTRLDGKQVKTITMKLTSDAGRIYISGRYTDNTKFILKDVNEFVTCPEAAVASGAAGGGAAAPAPTENRRSRKHRTHRLRKNRSRKRRTH